MKKIVMTAVMGAIVAMESGCAVTAQYACKTPSGLTCMSVEQVYDESVSGQLKETHAMPANKKEKETNEKSEGNGYSDNSLKIAQYPLAIRAGTPLRTQPVDLRIWFTPWVDENGDFHGQSYLYTIVKPGYWLLRENLKHLESGINPDELK